MPSYQQDSHVRKRDESAQKADAALHGWAHGVDTLEAGYADESRDDYLWALDCRSALANAVTTAVFKQRKVIEARLPELDRRFTEATVPSSTCVLQTRDCDSEVEWWYFRVPASHPEWSENADADQA